MAYQEPGATYREKVLSIKSPIPSIRLSIESQVLFTKCRLLRLCVDHQKLDLVYQDHVLPIERCVLCIKTMCCLSSSMKVRCYLSDYVLST